MNFLIFRDFYEIFMVFLDLLFIFRNKNMVLYRAITWQLMMQGVATWQRMCAYVRVCAYVVTYVCACVRKCVCVCVINGLSILFKI